MAATAAAAATPAPVCLKASSWRYRLVWRFSVRTSLCYHVNERYVDEDAGRQPENPRRCRTDVADQDADNHPDDAEHRRNEVVEKRLPDGHSGIE